MAYAIGHISGCHLNPAVSLGLFVGGRFKGAELPGYIIAQVLGGIAGAAVLYLIASGQAGFSLAGGFASNGYGAHSPGGYSLIAGLVAEVVLTFFFLLIILGATDSRAPQGFAPIAIGLGLTLIHLIGIPVTNLSVNPARSTGPAVFVGGWAVAAVVAVLGRPAHRRCAGRSRLSAHGRQAVRKMTSCRAVCVLSSIPCNYQAHFESWLWGWRSPSPVAPTTPASVKRVPLTSRLRQPVS